MADDETALDIMYALAGRKLAQRVPTKKAKEILAVGTIIFNGYVYISRSKSVGAGMYEVWMELSDGRGRALR